MDIGTDMDLAIRVAERAQSMGQRPFGSVIVGPDGQLLGLAGGSETAIDPTHHSEIRAIRAACRERGGLLYGCTLFQTHECCMGCCGFVLHAKISYVVVGSLRRDLPELFRQRDISMSALLADTSIPPQVTVVGGPVTARCIALFDDEVAQIQLRGPSAIR